MKRTLREGGVSLVGPFEHHLPAHVHHRQLRGFYVLRPHIPLQKRGHGKNGRWEGRNTALPILIHGLELALKVSVERLMPTLAQKQGQLARASQPVDNALLKSCA